MRRWDTDASPDSDSRYSWLVKFAARRGWYRLATLAKWAGV